jgi:transcription elongation factor Elf1
MRDKSLAAYVECPECGEEMPVNFTFFDLNEASSIVTHRCQGCGVELEAEMDIKATVTVNGSDWEDAEFYHR